VGAPLGELVKINRKEEARLKKRKEGNAMAFLIPRTTLRGLFGIPTTPFLFYF
jgi:hypothetical protein